MVFHEKNWIDRIRPTLGRPLPQEKQDICQDALLRLFLLFQYIGKKLFLVSAQFGFRGMHYSIVLRKISQDEPKMIYFAEV